MQQTQRSGTRRRIRAQTAASVLLAVLIGLCAGIGAVVFRWMISAVHDVMFGASDAWLGALGPARVIPLPAIGGLLVGLLVFFFVGEAKGSGIPEVILAVFQYGGRIRARVSVLKSIASALCIGSGGSAGREGPIVQISAALGSAAGQLLRLSEERVRLLVTCGAGAGVAATFNAPIGGALFALEVVLRDFGVRSFGLVVLSCVAATAFSRATLGDFPAFVVPRHVPAEWYELPIYALLGVLAAVIGVFFTRFLYRTADLFERLPIPGWAVPVIGGLLVGVIGSQVPEVLGVGYSTIEPALATEVSVGACALLVVAKLAATSLTIGSGGSGGVFAPCLFMGAVFGSMFGQLMQGLLPDAVTSAEGYAIAGMGAVFTGAAAAPVSSVLILFEMTADYRVIIPLMAAITVSSLVAERLTREDIYTIKLVRRGFDILKARPSDPMTQVSVEQVMTRQVDVVPANMPLEELVAEFQRTGHHGFPVVDKQGLLVGIIALSDLERAAKRGLHDRLVEDIMSRNVMTCHCDQTLREALAEPAAGEVGRLPVVDREDSRKLLGVLRRSDVIHAYTTGAAGLSPDEHPLPPEAKI